MLHIRMLKAIKEFWGFGATLFENQESLGNAEATKVWILLEVTSEKCNSDKLNTFFFTKRYLYY